MAADGRRRAIRLGAVSKRQAESVRGHVENLVAAALMHQAPPDETSRWIDALPEVWRRRFERAGLVTARAAPAPAPEPEPAGPTLGAFLAGYVAGRADLKESTKVALGQAVRYLVEHFGADMLLKDLRPADGDDWHMFLVDKGLSAATIRRRCGAAKQLLKGAVRRGLLLSNPFSDLKAANLANPKREFYVSRAVTEQVISACPDAQWRLLFALCRYGGLRCPSEPLGLTWQDIDWARGRFTVRSPKTEHHPGQESRVVPLFPALLPYLQEAFDLAEPGAERVFPKWQYKGAGTNLRTGLLRIMAKASVKPWPRLFQNLRASCETELTATFPLHVACAWLGHTAAVAAKHYLMVTEGDYQKAAQKAAQCRAVSSLPEREAEADDVQERPELPQDSETYTTIHEKLVGDTGLEHPAKTPANPQKEKSGGPRGAKSGALLPQSDLNDLARRLAALPESVRAQIAAVVKAADQAGR